MFIVRGEARAKENTYRWVSVTLCDERLNAKSEGAKLLTYTGSCEGLREVVAQKEAQGLVGRARNQRT